MRAAVFYGSNNIAYEEVYNNPIENKRDRFAESVLKVSACSVCAYDVRVFRNGHSKVTPPVILGHEICGETIEDIIRIEPSSATSIEIKSGTRVVISPIIPCLKCVYCSNKQYNLCNDLKEIGSSVNGGFAEYIKIPKQF
jgi:L-iditol 2-dehydrogenase